MSLAIVEQLTAGDLYDTALRCAGEPGERWRWFARYEGGRRHSLAGALGQWVGGADEADRELLARADGAVLDAGCGPGRLAAELADQGREALGVDTSRVAIQIARGLGATAVRRSIFEPVPAEGRWDTVLLADGNIGIGGDPVALLARCRELVAPSGRVLVELDPPGRGLHTTRIRLERGAERGGWFPWAHVAVDAVEEPAAAAGLVVDATWEHDGRSFASLAPRPDDRGQVHRIALAG
ncbi:class I SAM-dependent methyltransferase [Blastococcus goldschmidtiae]|uniref:Class I SAM-dependent methyltransferase n=1 Tax=Blastococcus goldschmidtiae TaxID=3075546 RepID=A0ABU2K8N0_9ACTN|nr:class I SAM-dependent methyltransferase [Blastococcus sp. DSM 46792]MDT0276545.1 class I SAM-dependent methyltransferase [Blastococcus sp. DSM 46792]